MFLGYNLSNDGIVEWVSPPLLFAFTAAPTARPCEASSSINRDGGDWRKEGR